MKTITINGKRFKLRGLSRTLQGNRVKRAIKNTKRKGFMQKYVNPRSFRLVSTMAP